MNIKPTSEQVSEWIRTTQLEPHGKGWSREQRIAELAAQWGAEQAQQATESGFWLSTEYINDFVVNSLKDLIRRAKRCSICDVDLRENGKNVRFEADWIKYMEWRGAAMQGDNHE